MTDTLEHRWVVLRWAVSAPMADGVGQATYVAPIIISEYRTEEAAMAEVARYPTVDTPTGDVPEYAYAIRHDIWAEGLR